MNFIPAASRLKDSPSKEQFAKLAAKGRKVALMAVAHSLAVIIHRTLATGQQWQPADRPMDEAKRERLDEFLTVVPSSMRWAVEIREPSWLHDDVFEMLRRHRAALCIHDMLPDHPWELTTDWSYIRFHGPEALTRKYYGRYGGRRLWRAANRMQTWLDGGCDVYAYFNNDWYGHAVEDATWLRDRLHAEAKTG